MKTQYTNIHCIQNVASKRKEGERGSNAQDERLRSVDSLLQMHYIMLRKLLYLQSDLLQCIVSHVLIMIHM